MKWVIYISSLCLVGFFTALFGWHGKYENEVKLYNHNGLIANAIKIWADTVSPSSSTYTVDISSAGFSGILAATATAQSNTSTVSSMPIAIIKSISNTAIVVNLVESNPNTTTILGIAVLSGTPIQLAPSTTGILLNVQVKGY